MERFWGGRVNMNLETIEMLCSPYTREALRYVSSPGPDGVSEPYLEGVETGERFPFRNGIPVLYDASLLEGYNLQYNAFYRKIARFYDPAMKMLAIMTGGSEAKFRRQYLQSLEIRDRDQVLEVSVGTGANLALLPEHCRCYGLDLSWEMLSQCQKNIQRWKREVELIYGNAETLPFRDGVFDCVFHVGGINAFNDREKAITEMIRVARSGTKIVIVDETSKLMKALSWMPSARKMIEEWGDRFEAPVNLIPAGMEDVRAESIVNGYFYLLSFRKP